jgi:hypothetical protein
VIDNGLLFDYRNPTTYINSVLQARFRLSVVNDHCRVLKDRQYKTMSKYAVAIFDETGEAAIDVLLMGNTLYVLAVRLAEHKWFISKKQPKEFAGSEAHVLEVLDFQSGYGELGVTEGSNTAPFRIQDCSLHVAALKTYMLTPAVGRSEQIKAAAKTAFAYFAMTVGEAIRFRSIAARMELGGIAPSGELRQLQRWVIDSSVRNSAFPNKISVAGVHEKTSSELFKGAMAELLDGGGLMNRPTEAELAGTVESFAEPVIQLLRREAPFDGNQEAYEAGMSALYSGYFKNRLTGTEMQKTRVFLKKVRDKHKSKKTKASRIDFTSIDQAID